MPTITLAQLSDVLSCLSGKNNYFGFDRADLAYKLMQYLRVGNANNSTTKNYGTSVQFNASDYSQKYRFNLHVSIFPFLAYKKFCQDYFRYSQWQNSSPYLWNIDYYTGTSQPLFSSVPAAGDSYWKNNTLFDLEYCNWNKDMFMGVLPDTQFGDVATIDTGGLKSQDLYVEAKISSSESSRTYLGAKTSSTGSDFAVNAGPLLLSRIRW